MTRSKILCAFTLLAGLSGCGDDSSRTDPGTGTGTLWVSAEVEYQSEDNLARLDVKVKRAGQNVEHARVRISNDLGSIDLASVGGGDYRGQQWGWSAAGYGLEVVVVDTGGKITDELRASLAGPAGGSIASPDLTKPVDARALPGDVLALAWNGPPADWAEIRTKSFEPTAFTPDPLSVSIPATMLTEEIQELRLTRQVSIALAGGQPGSSFTARHRLRTSLIVQNPY